MIRYTVYFVLLQGAFIARTDAQAILRLADSLISEKQYNSAFSLLDKVSGSDSNPEIVLKKADIALNWFVESIMHQIFAFKDLTKGESIDDYRGKEGEYDDMYVFKIDSVLTCLIRTHPRDGRLFRSLGDFYYDVFWKYGKQWLLPRDTIISMIRQNYLFAAANGMSDANLFHNLGVAYLQQQKFPEAIENLKKSLKLDPQFASANYNLAFAYSSIDSLRASAFYATYAYILYADPDLKADAAHLAGLSYFDMHADSLAIPYLAIADSISPQNYHFGLHLLQAYLRAREGALADKTATALLRLGPTKPRICSDILNSYYDSALKDSIPSLFSSLVSSNAQNPECVGNLYFHLSKYYGNEKDNQAAINYLERARTSFHNCLPDTHYVFKVIESLKSKLQKE